VASQQEDVAVEATFKALADPTRRQILKDLRRGELSAGEVASHFPISGPSTSRHLAVLKAAGLVSERRDANRVIYSLQVERLLDNVGAFLSAVAPSEPITRPGGRRKKKPKQPEKGTAKRKHKAGTAPAGTGSSTQSVTEAGAVAAAEARRGPEAQR